MTTPSFSLLNAEPGWVGATEREQQLLAQNHALAAEGVTLKAELATIQERLLQLEKMASLGELLAGVAHEINTPLGAIQAAIWNVHQSLQKSLVQLPEILLQLPPAQRQAFQTLLAWSQAVEEPASSREERSLRRHIQQQLTVAGIETTEDFASLLSQMGIRLDLDHPEMASVLLLLRSPHAKDALEMVYNLAALRSNSRNIQIAAKRAGSIVAALKHYSRQGNSTEKIETQIAEGLETVLVLYHNHIKHGIEVKRDYETVPSLWCYPEELLQVWSNLIGNAIYAMNGQGQLALKIENQPEGLRITISDSGTGISIENQKKIFEPFFTTKPMGEGCGLGLAIVAKIIAKHDGMINVESQPGQTQFRVFLPWTTC